MTGGPDVRYDSRSLIRSRLSAATARLHRTHASYRLSYQRCKLCTAHELCRHPRTTPLSIYVTGFLYSPCSAWMEQQPDSIENLCGCPRPSARGWVSFHPHINTSELRGETLIAGPILTYRAYVERRTSPGNSTFYRHLNVEVSVESVCDAIGRSA